ncbi:Swi5-domain-containing protein [Dendryphion nanum]|uniref:Swi5-domain-containing protein n=1 Tax=Dendryphion nanum TaxID=256645 RepID=A0A9P9DPK0_9PLEO|nr:Swi5-domain-containing protein [Dendryphion nanum]
MYASNTPRLNDDSKEELEAISEIGGKGAHRAVIDQVHDETHAYKSASDAAQNIGHESVTEDVGQLAQELEEPEKQANSSAMQDASDLTFRPDSQSTSIEAHSAIAGNTDGVNVQVPHISPQPFLVDKADIAHQTRISSHAVKDVEKEKSILNREDQIDESVASEPHESALSATPAGEHASSQNEAMSGRNDTGKLSAPASAEHSFADQTGCSQVLGPNPASTALSISNIYEPMEIDGNASEAAVAVKLSGQNAIEPGHGGADQEKPATQEETRTTTSSSPLVQSTKNEGTDIDIRKPIIPLAAGKSNESSTVPPPRTHPLETYPEESSFTHSTTEPASPSNPTTTSTLPTQEPSPTPTPNSAIQSPPPSSAFPPTPQETLLASLLAQKTALITSLTALPNFRGLLKIHTTEDSYDEDDNEDDDENEEEDREPTDAEVVAAANKIVKKHIKLLHEYNEIKDVGEGLMGLIAEQRGCRIVEVQEEFGIGGREG